MRRLYEDGAYYASETRGYSDYRGQEMALRLTFRKLLDRLDALGLTGGRLLEVGCGYGYLLREARDRFSYLEATDFAEEAVGHAAQWADRVHAGDVAGVSHSDFDLVIANHVVEHVYDPRAFVRELAARLRPGGTLLLSTPDMGSGWRRVMGRRWPSFKLPEHLLYFDRSTLFRLMNDAGLVAPEKVPYPHAFPLSLVAEKLGLRAPARLGSFSLWIPGTTLAVRARRPG